MEITTDLNEIKICHTVTVGEQKFSDPNQVMQEMIRQDVIQREVRHRTRAKHEKDYEDPRIFFQENFIRLNKKQQEVNTCIVPVKILMREGERYELSFGEIKRRAKKYGLVPCPQEVPIALGFLSKEPSELSNYWEVRDVIGLRNSFYVVTKPFCYHNALVLLSNSGGLLYALYAGLDEYFHSHYDLMVFQVS